MAKAKQPKARRRAKGSPRKPARRRGSRGADAPPATGFTVAEAARLLRLPPEVLTRHIAQGAPVDGDGHLQLVHYAAWLNGQAPGQSPDPNDADRPDQTESD